MDGLVEPADAVKKAFKYGHRAVAITDHGVAQGFPQAMLEYDAIMKSNPDADFKLIYGCEGYLIDNMIDIYSGNREGSITDTEFVVFGGLFVVILGHCGRLCAILAKKQVKGRDF